jgi:SNF2 family DNA or RNA helicase
VALLICARIDDDDSFVRSQEEIMALFNQQKTDAQLARDLQERGDFHNALPARLSQSSQPNAFDRIQSRPPPAPQPVAAIPATSLPNSPFIFGQPSSLGVIGQPWQQSGTQHWNVGQENRRYHVPGAFGNELDEEDDGLVIMNGPSTGFQPASQMRGTYSQSARPGQLLPPLGMPSRTSAAEQARNAALRRQGIVPEIIDLDSYTPLPLQNRPGAVMNGNYYGSQYYPPPGRIKSESHAGAAGLAELARRTAQYDWLSHTDEYGAPIPSRLSHVLDRFDDDDGRNIDEEIKNLLTGISGPQDFTDEEKAASPEQMKCTLYQHQLIALKWMQDIEDRGMEGKGNKGGILADDMGLGKTVTTLALMVTRPASDSIKTNLIIGPVALIKQWQTEIKRKVESRNSLSVYLLHGSNRKGVNYDQLRAYDVVLTTYGLIATEWKKLHDYQQAHPEENIENNRELQKKCPLLHPSSKFYRVILDEAQCIKNEHAQCSRGAEVVQGKFRWCLSGTPMQNGISELYALFRFLRIKPYDQRLRFRQAFGCLTAKNASSSNAARNHAMTQLRVVLKAVMIRRMKNSLIDGKPIVQLPEKTETKDVVEFSPDELDYYKELEGKSQVEFNKYLRKGTIGKNYSNILVLLLRLRQACCHPHLNMDVEPAVNAGDIDALANSMSEDVIARIKDIEAFECPLCYDGVPDPALVLPCGHHCCADCLARHFDSAMRRANDNGEDAAGTAPCFLCRQPIRPQNYIHYSAFKRIHLPEPGERYSAEISDISETDSEDMSGSESDDKDESEEEQVDRKGNLKDFIVDDDVEDSETAGEDEEAPQPVKKHSHGTKRSKSKKRDKKGKNKAEEVKPEMLKTLRIEAGKNMAARRRYMHYLKANWQDSAKVTKCIDLLAKIRETGEKTIIFSQWTALLDFLEVAMGKNLQLKHRRYDGSMSTSAREEAVRAFTDDARTTVLLVSLKAGNAGLNLTAASHIIICDPFWNPYVEMQAVDRAHRIGQQRKVKVHRLLTEGTVEDRIVALQEQKRAIVEGALDENESARVGRLTEQDLAYLFGVRR